MEPINDRFTTDDEGDILTIAKGVSLSEPRLLIK